MTDLARADALSLASDPDRLSALYAYGVIDTPPEDAFDRITRLAAHTFDVPYAFINFIDDDRQWTKSCFGTELEEVSLDHSFCVHTIETGEPLVVDAAEDDPRFEDNWFVTSEIGLRFYAGAPLEVEEGACVGTLCVADSERRSMSEDDLARLQDLAEVVVDLLEMRRALDERNEVAHRLQRVQTAVAHATDAVLISDDRRNPVYQNPSFVDLFGYSTKTLRRAGGFEALIEDDRAATVLRETLARKQSWSGTVEITSAHDQIRTVDLRASPVVDNDGSVLGYMMVIADETESERMQRLREGQNRILQQIAEGEMLPAVLTALVELVETQQEALRGSVLLLNEGRLQHGAAPHLPQEFVDAIDGTEIGSEVGTCGTAVYANETVVTRSIADDPRWEDLRDIALAHDLRACWSTPIRDEDGEVLGTFAFYAPTPHTPSDEERELGRTAARIASIAIERTHREAELRRSEARYRLLAENVRDIVTLHAPDGTYRWVSPSVEEVLGYSPDAIVGTSPFDRIHPDDADEVQTFYESLARERRSDAITYRIRHSDGHYVWLETLSRVLYDDDGKVAQIQASSRDVSDQVQHQRDLIEAKQEAEKMNRLKSAFLANMSHEIRTPLTSIIGFAEILQSEADDRHRRMSHLIHRAGTRLMETLDSVLQLSRLEAGMLQLDRQKIDVGEEITETVDLLRPRAQEAGIDLQTDVPDPPIVVDADPAALHRILNNVVGNAIKFTDDGGHVQVAVRQEGDDVVVEVEDDGVGIDASFVPELFDAFKQEQGGARRSFEGSGLGLTVVKRLVDAHGGAVEVDTEKGTGSLFRIRLPAPT